MVSLVYIKEHHIHKKNSKWKHLNRNSTKSEIQKAKSQSAWSSDIIRQRKLMNDWQTYYSKKEIIVDLGKGIFNERLK